MMSSLEHYRLLDRIDLAPAYTSLGLRQDLFADGGDTDVAGFDAVMSGPGDVLWIFRGEDFLGYDLRTDRILRPFRPIADGWANGTLPPAFDIGIDAALWAGPGFPHIVCLFRGGDYIQLDCSADPTDPASWRIVLGPIRTGNEWLRLPSPDGIPRHGPVLEPAAKLYGLRDDANRVHFFTRDGRYARHNLDNGEYDIAPTATTSVFPLPDAFGGRVDLAFYGAGAEAEHIFFVCRNDYAQYDIRRRAIVRSGAVEQRFPALGALLPRPQLHLVEDYAIETYVGPIQLGRLVSTVQILPQSRRTSVVVTRIVDAATMPLQQNMIEQRSQAALADFYDRLATGLTPRPPSAPVPDASGARVLVIGEVDASSGSGLLEERRDAFLDHALSALSDQANQSSYQVTRQLVDRDTAATISGEAVSKETFELANTTDQTRQVDFYEIVQVYETLFVLENIRLAYTNGRDRPREFALQEIDEELADILSDQDQASAVVAYIKGQLSRIQSSSGEMRCFLVEGSDLAVDAKLKTRFVFPGSTQADAAEIVGLVKKARTWLRPTYQTRAVDLPSEAADAPLSIARADIEAQPEIAVLMTADLPLPPP